MGRDVRTNGHPGGQKVGVSAPEKQLVVVDAGAQAAGDVVPQHCPLQEDFPVPAGEVADFLSEGRVLEELEVLGQDVRFRQDPHLLVCRWEFPSANAAVVVRRLRGVEDAEFWVCAWF